MMRLVEVLKSTLVGGALVVLPVALVVAFAGEAWGMVIDLVQPVVDFLPVEEIGGEGAAVLAAILIVLGICLAAGVVVRTTAGAGVVGWFEKRVLSRVPGYEIMRTLSRQVTGTAERDDATFSPAVLRIGPDALQLVYLIEDHGNGFCTVVIPSAPAAVIGAVQYVSRDRVERLDVPLTRVVTCLQAYGMGSRELFVRETRSIPAGQP